MHYIMLTSSAADALHSCQLLLVMGIKHAC
jgi:hypothetical protein